MTRSPSRRVLRGAVAVLTAAGLTVLAACGSSGRSSGTTGATTTAAAAASPSNASGSAATSPAPVAGTLTVFAAASLKATFTEISETFQ